MTVEATGYGADLRLMRAHRNMTQQMVARQMGVGKSTISKIESGEQCPTLAQVEAWAAACGFEVRLFFSLIATLPERCTTCGGAKVSPSESMTGACDCASGPRRDYCTDPNNCKRCQTATWDQANHEHAGIALMTPGSQADTNG